MTPRDEVLVPRDDVDRLLAAWFEADAPGRAPEAVAEFALARTAHARQRPRWLPFGRWPAMQTVLRFPSFSPVARAAWVLLAIALLLALAALSVGVFGGHRLPPPFGPAHTGLLTYDGNGDIYVANPDGTNSHAITSGPAVDTAPVWSLDGEHIAYFSKASANATEQSVVVVDAAGGNRWVVATPHTGAFSSVSWAPDGHRLAYIDNVQVGQPGWADAGDLAVADLTTRTTRPITHGLAASDPAWAPDGQRIAFKVSDMVAGTSWLYIVGVDGANPHVLSTVTSDNAGFSTSQWSPDGSRILAWASGPNHQVFVIDPGTGQATNVTNTPQADDFWATWSNDGTRIAYETLRGAGRPIDDVHVMNADGTNDRLLTTANVTGADLYWSPDDHFLIGFDSNGTSSANAVVIPVDGTTPATLIPAPSNSLTGSWQRR